MTLLHKPTLGALLFALALGWSANASAEDTLCDASSTNCRTKLIALIDNETQGIDIGYWFIKDYRYVTALENAQKRGVAIRIVMDPRANAQYPENQPAEDRLKAAGIPMRKRTAGDICHWKLMIFAGQGIVEWSGANFSPTAFVPQDPYKDYEDEVIFFSQRLLPSFMTMYDNIWTNTKEYASFANVPATLVRNYPTAPIDPRLNFPPKDSYQDRLVPLIDKEPSNGWIDVDIYRITLARPVDALIRAASRGVRIRMYLEPNEYANTARPGNKTQMDRLVAAAQQYPGTIEIRMRKHLGLNHQKTTWFHSQHVVAFGTSNWSDASDDNQLEANIFTDKVSGDPLNDFLFTELLKVFERKWYNASPVGAIETEAWRTPTLPPPTEPTTCGDTAATNYGGPLPCTYPPPPPPPPPPAPGAVTVVMYPAKATITGTRWQVAADTTAAAGSAMWNPNLSQNKIAPPLAAPPSYVEATFDAKASTAYRIWVRMRAENNSTSNDSLHMQFSDSINSSGAANWRIGTSSSAEFILQDGPSGGNPSGWGWADNGWGAPGEYIYFAANGTHTLRLQQREDGPFVDQIVISPDTYLVNAPGPRTADNKILPEGSGSSTPPPSTCTDPAATNNGGPLPCTYPPPPGTSTVVVYPAHGTLNGNWQLLGDGTAAGGSAAWNPNANQTKVSPALVAPANYVEKTFDANAGVAYHVWIRMRAEGDSLANDSVHLQFSDSVTSGGAATQRIGTSSSAEFVLQNGSGGAPDKAWGWTDNGWDAPGAPIYFATSGTHTLRMQQREDGAIVDQIVLSPDAYQTIPPGPRSNDTTILPETSAAPPADTCNDPAATNNGGPAPCTYPPPPETCNDPAATNNGGPAPCTYPPPPPPPPSDTCSTVTLDAASKNVGKNEANWTITVTAPSSTCTWAATADADWLVVKGTTPTAMPVAGSGTIKVRAVLNTTGASRTSHFIVNGVTYTVKQGAS